MLLTREQLQERLVALHRASLELVKDVSLETLLERIVATACEQVDARYAALGVLDDEGKLAQFISVGLTDKEIKRIVHPPVGLGLIGALMNTETTIRIPVIHDHPRSVGFPANHPLMNSFLGVPIRIGDRQLGQIYLTEKIDALEFSADDEMIIQMLASYAATAIKNARLYEQMKQRDLTLTRRNVDMSLLNGIASTLTSSLELDEILNKTLGLVMNYMKVEAGDIFLLEEDKTTLRMVLHRGQAAEAFWTRNIFVVGEGYPGLVAKSRQPMIGRHLASDTNFLRDAIVQAGFQQIACIPLISGDNLMGVMSVATRANEPLDERNIQMLIAVGAWAGLAIENARLHSNARRLAVLEERDRIGMDLHDGIIQSIYGVGLGLEGAQLMLNEDPQAAKAHIRQAIDGLNQAIRDIRAYILDLRPRQLGNEGLLTGIKRLIAEYRAHTFSEVNFTGPETDLKDLPHTHSLALFHICQEALANAAKHAKAKNVQVAIWTTNERALMEIRDDGKGFDTENMHSSIGHGLANMQTRAHAVGGEFDISSIIDEGTTILVWVPRVIGRVIK
ncbi:MAG TPA: GAF domain-containing sensor histidine kinase [Anaerolineales bacterium]|nr:GAF domain-containing sensor histidine kinase [Anaerolineales bacterium]HMV96638.1 GAF domain-containing sensor histidine kinase [Anaerolineales bacterium]HMX19308.1 GAF domain-containing sensor histidine kinase [Anaerolineales bacterium]HMX73841.1 GAF domain-containing sensor histidine kinase [Anaerolineales bacterium]HMZ42292.1 GAF domain-containing sensor histidine kinase [Anaerolineales bacterium]